MSFEDDPAFNRLAELWKRGPDGEEVDNDIIMMGLHDEYENQKIIAEHLLKPGDRAIELFAAYNLDFILFASGVVGKEGRVYPISFHELKDDPNFIFETLAIQLRDFLISKYDDEDSLEFQGSTKEVYLLIEGMEHYEKIIKILREGLSQDYLDVNADYRTYSIKEDAQKFCKELGIHVPEQVRVPPFPAEIEKGSINLIIEQNFFNEQEEKESLLKACDEMLVPEGFLIFREFKYDVFQLIKELIPNVLPGYDQVPIPPLKNYGMWQIYQKQK